MAHSFYAYSAPPIVVGVLLTCQSLDPEYKTNVFKNIETLYYIQVNTVTYLL